jgi:hypothetical protein
MKHYPWIKIKAIFFVFILISLNILICSSLTKLNVEPTIKNFEDAILFQKNFHLRFFLILGLLFFFINEISYKKAIFNLKKKKINSFILLSFIFLFSFSSPCLCDNEKILTEIDIHYLLNSKHKVKVINCPLTLYGFNFRRQDSTLKELLLELNWLPPKSRTEVKFFQLQKAYNPLNLAEKEKILQNEKILKELWLNHRSFVLDYLYVNWCLIMCTNFFLWFYFILEQLKK